MSCQVFEVYNPLLFLKKTFWPHVLSSFEVYNSLLFLKKAFWPCVLSSFEVYNPLLFLKKTFWPHVLSSYRSVRGGACFSIKYTPLMGLLVTKYSSCIVTPFDLFKKPLFRNSVFRFLPPKFPRLQETHISCGIPYVNFTPISINTF